MQLLLLLLKAGREGIGREEFFAASRLEAVHAKKRTSNFRQQLYKLRKVIRESDMPEGRYIVLRQGRYYFTLEYDLYTDTEELDRLIGEIRNLEGKSSKEEKEQDFGQNQRAGAEPGGIKKAGTKEELQEAYRRYCDRYHGEFLPMLSGEDWATTEAAYYQKWYTRCLKKLCSLLKKENRYEELLRLCTAASQYHPYDEWQAVQIECLMALNRQKEAWNVYEKTAELFYHELGLIYPKPNIGQCPINYIRPETAGRQVCRDAGMLDQMKKELGEDGEEEGAYYCGYPSFLDIYHIVSRIGERGQGKNSLLLCTLSFSKKEKGENHSARVQIWMEQLNRFLGKGLRREDVYTRYSDSQYLAILAGADLRAGKNAAARLRQAWKRKNPDEPAGIRFSVQEIESIRNEDGYGAQEIS